MGWIELYNKNGQQIDLDSLGLLGLKLGIPSPSYDVETESIEGMDGEVEIDLKLKPRNLTAFFWSKARDYEDSLYKRNEIYGLLGNGKEYYVEESKNTGKRWKVRVGDWDPNRLNSRIQEIEIPLIAKSGVSETATVQTRTFTSLLFRFKNEGNRAINMRNQNETEIMFSGASTGLTITNKTTGEQWKYNGNTTANDVLLLKGVRSLKNGSSIFGSTNKKLIGFAPGWNDFEITGATDFTIEIRTRFYFL
jgi:hypothetical protein